MRLLVLALSFTAWSFFSCKANDSETTSTGPSPTTAPNETDTGGTGVDPGTATGGGDGSAGSDDGSDGTTDPKGTVQFGVTAVIPGFQASSGAQPGTLAVGLGLTGGANLVPTTTDYSEPLSVADMIASGAPDTFVLTIKKIVLSYSDNEGGDGGISGPLSLKANHVELFNDLAEPELTAITAMVDVVYDDSDAFIAALLTASGLTEDEATGRLESVMDELAAEGSDAATPQTLLDDEAGRQLRVENGSVDLSALFEAESSSFGVDPGTYNQIRIVFANRAQIKGCVRMKFRCNGQSFCDTNGPTDNQPGNNGVTGEFANLLYCTQSDHSPYVDGTQNSDFIDQEPELMDFPIAGVGPDWPGTDDVIMDFRLPEPVEVTLANPVDLTLVIDLNRMLRFYNRGRSTQSVNPGGPTDKAFFFTTVFEDSVFAFAGRPGRIYGYQMLAEVCQPGDTYDPVTETCGTTVADGISRVGFWMTMITAPSGAPIRATLMPDDDNTLTITKGSVTAFARCPNDDNSAWLRVSDDQTTAAINYALCDHESDENEPGPYGRIYNFPADLEANSAAPNTEAFDGGDIEGILIETNQRQNSELPDSIYRGRVRAKRRL